MKTLLPSIAIFFFVFTPGSVFAAPTAPSTPATSTVSTPSTTPTAPTTGQACSESNPCATGNVCSDSTCVLFINITKSAPTPSVGGSSSCTNGQGGLCNPLKVDTLQALLVDILGFIIQIGTVIIVLMLVLTGFKFVLARGNPTELSKAKEMLVWTLIGALIILGSKAIAMGVQSTIHAIQITQ